MLSSFTFAHPFASTRRPLSQSATQARPQNCGCRSQSWDLDAVDNFDSVTPFSRPATRTAASTTYKYGVPPGVPTGYAEPHQSVSTCNLRIVRAGEGENSQPLEMKGAGAVLHRPASNCISAPRGTLLERALSVLLRTSRPVGVQSALADSLVGTPVGEFIPAISPTGHRVAMISLTRPRPPARPLGAAEIRALPLRSRPGPCRWQEVCFF